MNVVVSNKQKEIIDNANIDAIKDLNGLFNVNDLINKFKNYFFSKMILDATSIVDFASKDVLTTLANEIGAEKLIILLPSSPEPPLEFKKLLIELKIYNFTTNIDDVIKFIEKPNTYEDALKSIDSAFSDDVYVDNSIKEGEVEQNSFDHEDNTSNNGDLSLDNQIDVPLQNSKSSLGDLLNNLTFNHKQDQEGDSNDAYEDNNVTTEGNNQNIDFNKDIVYESNNTNLNNNIFLIPGDYDNDYNESSPKESNKAVIGFKGITIHAGCTSLIYMLHKMLINMKKDVISIEVGKNDFRLFRDSKMISVNEDELENVINNLKESIILVDLNDYTNFSICNEVLYLVEPSTIKLNGLMATNRYVFRELKDKKVLLNKSLLSPNDIQTLESEAGIKFFDIIEPLNDRLFNDSIAKLLELLNLK